jgi:hypothetical protein
MMTHGTIESAPYVLAVPVPETGERFEIVRLDQEHHLSRRVVRDRVGRGRAT